MPGVDAGITYDELRGADMLANARKRLENEMRPRGIEPDGEQAVKDAETVRQAGLNAITPSFFELFEDYITEEDSQLAADGVELEARTAWMHEMYRAMLNTLKDRRLPNRKPFAGASAPVRLPCGKQQRNIKKPADIIGITRKETCHASSEHGSAHQH